MCVCVCVRERQTAGVGEEMDSEEIGVGYVLSLGFPNNFPCIKSELLDPIGNDTSPSLYKKTLRPNGEETNIH